MGNITLEKYPQGNIHFGKRTLWINININSFSFRKLPLRKICPTDSLNILWQSNCTGCEYYNLWRVSRSCRHSRPRYKADIAMQSVTKLHVVMQNVDTLLVIGAISKPLQHGNLYIIVHTTKSLVVINFDFIKKYLNKQIPPHINVCCKLP